MSVREIKAFLRDLSKESLIELILMLYQKNQSVKEQLDFRFTPNETELLKSYKVKVLEAFYPKRGDMFHLKVGKKAISDFIKLKPSIAAEIDLMIYYVECGVKLTMEYGDIDENFYSSLEGVYLKAMKLIEKTKLHEKFEVRAYEIVNETKNIGWGFHDFLTDVYGDIYK